jgi:hypothetical protein
VPSPVQTAVAQAHRTARALAWVDVVYVAGADRLSVRAIKSQADAETVQADGSQIAERVTTWRIERIALVKDGQQIRPARGHLIEYLAHGLRLVYEVQPAAGLSAYSPADPFEYAWIIRSKLVSETA